VTHAASPPPTPPPTPTATSRPPLIGITADADAERFFIRRPYVTAIAAAGGVPVVLVPSAAGLAAAARCDGLVLSGGDDPDMGSFGRATHPSATVVDPERQAFELELLAATAAAPDRPVLGICLGMQLMALAAGGDLDQHLPDRWPTADLHWGHRPHAVRGSLGAGEVDSHHRQAVTDPGRLDVVAVADDGLIEAIRDPDRRFFLGVQWHPERTTDPALGPAILESLVAAAAAAAAASTTASAPHATPGSGAG
jgi:putative glutamine amidotransferase